MSVRQATGAAPIEPGPDPVRRELHFEGDTWIAEVAGKGLAGYAGDAAAPTLLVTFRVENADQPEREVLLARGALDDLSPLELQEAFDASTPYRGTDTAGGIFPATRQRRDHRRR